MGCSVHVNGRRSFGDWDGSTAIVRVNEDGRATVITGEGEIGQGNLTVLRQIAAEVLGLPYEHVDITRPDTDLHSHSLGALASRLTYVAGNAVKNAAAAAAAQLLEAAAEQFKRPASELTIINGEIGPRNGAETDFKPVGAIARANIYQPGGQPIVGVGNFDNPSEFPDHNRYGNESGAYNFIAQAAEVEVDRATGEVKLLEIASAVDCGTVINPATAIGQVQGGVIQGVGLALTEYFDWWNGQPTDPQLKDYPIPGAALVPKLHVAFAESWRAVGPVRRERAGRDRPRCRFPPSSRTRSPTRWACAYTNCRSPPRKSTARCTRGCTRTRRRPPPGGAEGRHVVAHLLRATVRRASARPGARARRERRGGGQAPRRRRSGARLRRHVACAAPRAHRLPAGEAPRLDRPHPGIERENHRRRAAPCGQGRRCASRRSTTTRASSGPGRR